MRRSLFPKMAAAASALVLAACGLAVPQAAAEPQEGKKPGEAIEKVETVIAERLPPAEAAISPAVRKDALRLIALMKIVETEMKSVDPLVEQLKQKSPNVPANVWDDVRREILKEFNPQSLRDAYVPLFARRFTPAELRSLVRFYASPVGQKFVDKMVEVQAEAFLIGIERGTRLGERIRARLKSLGYDSNIG